MSEPLIRGCLDRYKRNKCEIVEEIPIFGPQLLGLIDYSYIRACFSNRDDMHKVCACLCLIDIHNLLLAYIA